MKLIQKLNSIQGDPEVGLINLVIRIISAIRESFDNSVLVYTNGGCYKFHKILKSIFPEAKGYYNSDHVITEIDGRFYDITGEAERTNHLLIDEHYEHSKLDTLGFSGFIEIKHDFSTLPKDGQEVKFQTENEEWHIGYYVAGENIFTYGTDPDREDNFTSAWNVIQWAYTSDLR